MYSYIESAAVKIGDDVLEVSSFGTYALNGVESAWMPGTLSGYEVQYYNPSKNVHVFQIIIQDDEKIVLRSFKDLVSVMIEKASPANFGSSVGLMGKFPDGTKVGRDGVTVFDNMNEFGQEWMVQPELEGSLFRTVRAPQYPEKCVLPDATKTGRRLGGSVISRETAEKACGHWKETTRAMCVSDVLAMNDLEVAWGGAF